jgi:YidC/Oxa1 family membrane protein insertase
MNVSIEKIRPIAWMALAGALFLGYLTWEQDYPPPTPLAEAQQVRETPSLPALPTDASKVSTPATSAGATPSGPSIASNAPTVDVSTDVLHMQISTQGGVLQQAEMLHYAAGKDHPEQYVRLLDSSNETFFALRSGLRGSDPAAAAPTHVALFTAAASNYQLAAAADTLVVPLTWSNEQGVRVTKTYTFKRGSYIVDVDYLVENGSATDWQAASYVQVVRHQPVIKASILQAETYAFMGPTIGDGKSRRNLKLDDKENQGLAATYTGGWLAAMQHHFVVAAVPPADQSYDYHLNIQSSRQFTFDYRGPLQTVSAGAQGKFHETLFVGPKLQAQLKVVGSGLELTTDYGIFAIIAGPLFILLSWVHGLIGNWGWAIILTTLLIKLVFYKLTEASGKSMAKMREVAPRMKELQERYKDDREQLGRATMEFYKREKINPLAGCLPMLVQMPVFMAFYWVILNAAEMRQAPFLGYLTDLTARDPYFILPLILGVLNFAQFRLNPAPADPVQAKVMMFMPILMTGMMVLFPTGLVLYWITNTGLSILQQWHINRVVAGASKKPA